MVTQHDVAKKANVSFITVSRVVNQRGNVKEETRQRVLEAIAELNYHPNSLGRGLHLNKINIIGIVIATNFGISIHGTAYYNELMIGMELACTDHSYDMLIPTQKYCGSEFDFLKLYYERSVDGIILVAPDIQNPQIKEIHENNIPCVIINERPPDNFRINYIDTDNKDGTIKATEYLVKKGHTKIAFLKGVNTSRNVCDRLEGYLEIMEKYKLPVDNDWILPGDYALPSGREAVKKLLTVKNFPTAILCANDLMALGVLMEARNSGVRIPDDLSVIGFDGIESARYTIPSLATVRQPLEDIGYTAAEMLFRKLKDPNHPQEIQIFPVEFIPGESVKELDS
jgi:DNA-binding LacI/PurR family transcriptional regulator